MSIKRFIKHAILKLIKWCMSEDKASSTNNMFNSIRINALVEELAVRGNISIESYEERIENNVNDIVQRGDK